jgi:site-specific recombinase XerC
VSTGVQRVSNAGLIRDHVTYLRRQGARPETIKHRIANLQRLAKSLPVDLLDADAEQLAQWQDGLRESGKSIATIRCYTSHARCLYRWAAEYGRRADDPTRDLRPGRVPVGRARPIDEDTLRVAIACAPEPVKTWLILAAYVGLRAGEIAKMSHEDVGDETLEIPDGKGGKSRTVPLPAAVREHLAPRRSNRAGRMWLTALGTAQRPDYVSKRCAEHLRDCGAGPGITLHKLRHRYATRMYALSKDARLVQHLIGHGSLATTQIYLDVDGQDGAKWADRLASGLKRGNPRKRKPGQAPRAAGEEAA